MKLAKARFVDPAQNAVYGTVALAVSFFVFAYSTDYGKPAILVLYMCWLPLLVMSPQILLQKWQRLVPLAVLPAVCILSTGWSDVAHVTLRAALQYASTILCGLIAARVLAQATLVVGGLLGLVLVLGFSYLHGHYAYDGIDGSYAFAGAFHSKNMLGYFASLGLIFSLSAWLLFEMGSGWRIVAAFVGAWCALALVAAKSATATITVVGAVAVMLGALVLLRLSPASRRLVLAIGVMAFLVLAVAAWHLGVFGDVLGMFGKDTTLTGRTYLWSQGLQQGATHPLFGLGYRAFWVPGRPLAEQLWKQFYITTKTGFHFHDTLIEAFVELGLLGVLLVASILFRMILFSVRVLLNRRRTGEAALAASLCLLFVIRSFVEIDFFTPYTVGSFLVWLLLLQMADQRAAEVRELGSRFTRPRHRSVHSALAEGFGEGSAP